ncbi:MAG: mannose-6-phosphate isomerase, class I [Candidatus Euphemobacter frigidus]|nr:mannose-6-phosphate isomerase, class I [Candidatus Euphemobacter frigidus]MDP8276064.1 mannose-6-phosphate isomerase, class I [Candidatus Euphemobacter frigidus]
MNIKIYRLDNPIREYAWGSETFISNLLGIPSPAPAPQAELWLGSNPQAPSLVREGKRVISLRELILEDPVEMLGEQAAERFSDTLPFLLKVLSAARPLSIQAHPDIEQAREGFERENAAGIPLDALNRNYKDPNHKPELICALTPFELMSGFRDPREIAGLLTYLDLGAALPGAEILLADPTDPSLRALFEALLSISGEKRDRLLAVLLRHVAAAPPRSEKEKRAFSWVDRLSHFYPGDIGILAPILLNTFRLQPGEALYNRAGVLHAYLEGSGIEIMANSDNVLRGGLTTKYINPAELLKILSGLAGPADIVQAETTDRIEFIYRAPAREFELSRIRIVSPASFTPGRRNGPEILLCVEGSTTVIRGNNPDLQLQKGGSIFIPFGVGSYTIRGEGVLYRAAIPGS